VVVVLRYMYLSSHRDKFFESLPTSNEGTLFGRLLKLEKMVRAKTGTLRWVSCISGYAENQADNDVYAFSLLFNNYAGNGKAMNALQERMIEAMTR
jgi:D-alanyl-D-alanine carboxypeptidase